MKYIFSILIGLLFIQAPAQNFQLAKGTVFHDENKNRIIDEGEKGVPGVMVSNQEMVVLTDENGYYELPVDSQTTIFITEPLFSVPLQKPCFVAGLYYEVFPKLCVNDNRKTHGSKSSSHRE